MRILELEICDVRGIRHLSICPQGKNLVVVGPNGSGKSGLVDAIDFLLTGKIQRLVGEGTGVLRLKDHGPHLGSAPGACYVRAVIQVPNVAQPIEIRRTLNKPDQLDIPNDVRNLVEPVLLMAQRGQYVLSRREILKYVTAKPNDRLQQITELLNLNDIDAIRQSVVNACSTLKKSLDREDSELKTRENGTASAAHLTSFDEAALLQVINENRAVLGGQPLLGFTTRGLLDGVVPLVAPAANGHNVSITSGDIALLLRLFERPSVTTRSDNAAALIAAVGALRTAPELLRESQRLNLYEDGADLIGDDGSCPLCDTPWAPGELARYLSEKSARSKAVAARQQEVRRLAAALLRDLDIASSSARMLQEALKGSELQGCSAAMAMWQTKLSRLRQFLADPVSASDGMACSSSELAALSMGDDDLAQLHAAHEWLGSGGVTVDPVQTARDLLVRMEEHTKLLEAARAKFAHAKAACERAVTLETAFLVARDKVLHSLYCKIRDRFVTLYRLVHSSDESDFGAVLQPAGAGLTFEVDFHGAGTFPPHALHSEGHQDSMGLCLYLALAEHLSGGVIDLVVLDDVVMSVDSTHRREICRMLAKEFASRQFIITTHERAWAGQLCKEGVAIGSNCFTFHDWTLQTGPHVDLRGESWEQIRKRLKEGDISGSAHALRYALEESFRHVSGTLRAPVPYNLREQWDLGQFQSAAIGQLGKYYDGAIRAAASWGREDEVAALRQRKDELSKAAYAAGLEQGQINSNVHFNDWANFSAQDLEPVIDAMQHLWKQFVCEQCDGVLEAQGVGLSVSTVRCACNGVMMNLEGRKEASVSGVLGG